MSDRRVSLVFEGSDGAARFYLRIGGLLQKHGYRVSMVGPVDYQSRAQSLGLAYVALPGLEYKEEILMKPAAHEAIADEDLPKLVQFLDEEQARTQDQSLYTLCQALKGFEPNLVLCSSRPLHYVLAIGNALCLPVLLLTLQSPAIRGLPMVGDYLDQVSWYGQKESRVAAFLKQSEQQVGAMFTQWLGASSKFWPTARQLIALAGEKPQFPLFQARSLTSIFLEMRSCCPDRYYIKPVLPKLPPNVFEVIPFGLDKSTELSLPEFPREENRMVEDMMTENEQPVLFSFGHLSAVNPQHLTELCVRALYSSQLRGIIETGVGGPCLDHLDTIEDSQERDTLKEYCKSGKVIFVKNICLARIVPRIGLIVHDGGTFLGRYALESHRPQIILPTFGEGMSNAASIVRLWVGRASESLNRTTPQWLADSLLRVMFEQDSGFNYSHIWNYERRDEKKDSLKGTVVDKISQNNGMMSSKINYRWQSWKTMQRLCLNSGKEDAEKAFLDTVGDYWEKSISTGLHLQQMEDLREKGPGFCCCRSTKAKRVHEEP